MKMKKKIAILKNVDKAIRGRMSQRKILIKLQPDIHIAFWKRQAKENTIVKTPYSSKSTSLLFCLPSCQLIN